MSNKENGESQPLTEVSSVDIKREVGDSSSRVDLSELPYKCLCCNFRVRVIGIVILLLLQLPILGYYYMASDSYITKFTNSYKNVIMDGVFGQQFHKNNISDSVLSTSTVKIQFISKNNSLGVNPTTITTRNILLTTNADGLLKNLTSVAITVESKTDEQTAVVKLQANTSTTTPISSSTVPTTSIPVYKTTSSINGNTTSPSVFADGSILPECPPDPPNLQGPLAISFKEPPDSFEKTVLNNPLMKEGGHAKPPLCLARHKVAIIIPYRDRVQHLQYFVEYMHPILQRQQLDYQIFIINQAGQGKFNRAKLMNIGFLESIKLYPFNCFAFHDVDLILEDDRSLYWCSDRPRHLSAGVDKFNYVLPYSSIFGGVTLLSKKHMESINGFSNEFWGWGGEDDDVYNRLNIKGLKIIRYPMNIARYKMITHKHEKGNEANPKRFEMIRKTRQTFEKDGINSIKYKVLSIEYQPTYTNITVDVMGPS